MHTTALKFSARPLTSRDQAARLSRTGWCAIFGAIVPIGLWATFAPLSMAVIAPAFVKVDLNRRPVQHLEGGIVREVLVRDGEHVKAGQPVLILGDVGVDADRNRLGYRIHVERVGIARLEAEQARARVLVFPAALLAVAQQDERVHDALIKEKALFEARRNALTSEAALLRTQGQRVVQESTALHAQISQMEAALALQQKDLDVNRNLLKDGFISPTRIAQIESGVIDYSARLEERRSELARAAQRMGEIDLKIQSSENTYAQMASDQLKVAISRLGEIEQEVRKSEDAAVRQVVAAPTGGQIIDLKFTSAGAILRPGDAIAEIVPDDAKLTIEARIRPEEIDHVFLDQRARVKITSFKYRTTSMLAGKVSYVSADRLVDRSNNMPYFSVTIVVDDATLQTASELKLQAGMPAEVYIEGVKRTPLEYVIEPVAATIRKAGKQM
jgi:epimerase transport system membrane fusion protein